MKSYYMKEYFKLDGRSFIHHLYSQKIINKLIIFFRFGILIKENKSKKRSSYKKKKLPSFLPILFSTWTDEHNASIVSCNGPIICSHYSSIVIAHKQLVILIQLTTKGSAKGRKQGIYTSITISTSRRTCSSTRHYRWIVNWAQFFLRTWQQSLRIDGYFCVFVSVIVRILLVLFQEMNE